MHLILMSFEGMLKQLNRRKRPANHCDTIGEPASSSVFHILRHFLSSPFSLFSLFFLRGWNIRCLLMSKDLKRGILKK